MKTSGRTKKLDYNTQKIVLNVSPEQIKKLRIIALQEDISIGVLIHRIFKDELKRITGEEID